MCIDIIKNITDYPTGERRAGFSNTGLDRKSCIFEIAESADHTDFAVDVKFFQLF